MMDYQKRCQNEDCRKLFITIRPKAKYCCQSCAGQGAQALSISQPKDHEYLRWVGANRAHIKYLSMSWTKRGPK